MALGDLMLGPDVTDSALVPDHLVGFMDTDAGRRCLKRVWYLDGAFVMPTCVNGNACSLPQLRQPHVGIVEDKIPGSVQRRPTQSLTLEVRAWISKGGGHVSASAQSRQLRVVDQRTYNGTQVNDDSSSRSESLSGRKPGVYVAALKAVMIAPKLDSSIYSTTYKRTWRLYFVQSTL